jgi:hypothetical protein
MKAKHTKLLVSLGILIAISACDTGSTTSGSPASQLIQARDNLAADLERCTATYGYDPNNVSGVSETSLAPHELEWRQCAYAAIRTYDRASPSLSAPYERLIAEDMSMTTAIQQGTMTRGQRRDRIDSLVEQIKVGEQKQVALATSEQARQNEQMRRVLSELRGFR